ncbi:MAG TPA: hypothetical protein VHJ82_02485 [Actinomycetota bacterium]|nr:hypothetical protein [Actinomycetota bacterium]
MADVTRDYFARARTIAAAGLFAAAAIAIAGAFLHWAAIDRLPPTVPTAQAERAEPLRGVDIPGGWFGLADGWWVIIGAGVLVIAAVQLVRTGRSTFGWLAFWAAVVLGAITIADFRGISRPTSELAQRLDRIGEVEPGIGLVLTAVATGLALVAALAGVAGAPKPER